MEAREGTSGTYISTVLCSAITYLLSKCTLYFVTNKSDLFFLFLSTAAVARLGVLDYAGRRPISVAVAFRSGQLNLRVTYSCRGRSDPGGCIFEPTLPWTAPDSGCCGAAASGVVRFPVLLEPTANATPRPPAWPHDGADFPGIFF